MAASIKFDESTFTVSNKPQFRAQPDVEFEHRLKTREHLTFLRDNKLFDVRDSRWAKKTIKGEVVYAHEYMDCLLVVRLTTADNTMNLTHNEDGSLDRRLMDDPGEKVVYSITSENNGIESNHFFKSSTIGLSSVAIICAALAMTVSLANGLVAAEAALAAGAEVATIFGLETTVFPGVGIALAVLALIGIWIAYEIGREIVVNLIYENRSKDKALTLVDHYLYNLEDDGPTLPVQLNHLHGDDIFEFYDDAVIDVDNVSKFRGVGVSMKFQKADGSALVICIRNDIYYSPNYTIQAFAPGGSPTAQQVYDNCKSGGLIKDDFQWGDLVVKNTLDPGRFNQYTFAGVYSFNDAT